MTVGYPKVVSVDYSVCPVCDGRRYRTRGDVNRYGEAYSLWQCDARCEDGEVASIDIDRGLDPDTKRDTLPDHGTGRHALVIVTLDSVPCTCEPRDSIPCASAYCRNDPDA